MAFDFDWPSYVKMDHSKLRGPPPTSDTTRSVLNQPRVETILSSSGDRIDDLLRAHVKSSNSRSVAAAKLSPPPPPPPNRLPSINLKSWLWPLKRWNHLETENLTWRISTQRAKLGRWLSTARRNFAKAGALTSGANHIRPARPRSLLPLLGHDYTSKNMY